MTGWLPGTLSAAGREQAREQARELGARRRRDGITAVFSSDLDRAVQTADIAFAGSRCRPTVTAGYASVTTATSTDVRSRRWNRCVPGTSTGRSRAAAGATATC